jgi:aryl-alcohol dehydrogenase-like predicted oxidoreductase
MQTHPMSYRLLGSSGLRVSELCLGTMTFGTSWGYGTDYEGSRAIYQRYTEAGGNFFDTANRYTEGESEVFLGRLVREFGHRDTAVVATKYSLVTEMGRINDGGNHKKNLVQSVEGSLRRLQMDYIDLLYVHAWDFTVTPETLMRSLDDMVRQGKVLHVAISDAPAWQVARCNTIAQMRGWSPFTAFQAEYSLITRDVERDILPLCVEDNMPLIAWGPLGGGALTGKYVKDANTTGRVKPDSKRRSPKSTDMARLVVELAAQRNVPPAAVALRWLMQGPGNILPVVGARNADQLSESLASVGWNLDETELSALQNISAIDIGWPHDFLRSDTVYQVMDGGLQQQFSRPIPKLR